MTVRSLSDTLTDGQSVHLGADNRPVLNYKGFVTQNTNGVWSILCDEAINFDTKGAETSGFVCIGLGFKGYRFFNKTTLSTSKLDITRTTRQNFKQIWDKFELDEFRVRQTNKAKKLLETSNYWADHEPIVGAPNGECRALYVECVPFATQQLIEIISPEDQTKLLDLHPLIHPQKKPFVIVEPAKEDKNTAAVNVRFPWMAEVYVNGQMRGIGILLEHYWVLTTTLAMESVE